MLDIATGSTGGFERVQTLLTNLPAKLILWFFLVALFYHLIAGIHHYINPIAMRLIIQVLVIFTLIIYFFWGVEILWKIV